MRKKILEERQFVNANWKPPRTKKIAAILMAAGLCISVTACQNSEEVSFKQTQSDGVSDKENVSENAAASESEETDAYVDSPDKSDEGLKLVWSDEFDGDSLDTTKWSYQIGNGEEYGIEGWGNSELQYYTDHTENVKVEDGKLIITAVKEESTYEGMQYTSGRLRTVTDEGKVLFATTYGRAEARMKLPAGEGLWPAFWMLPVDETIYGGWAASGEIDIMEARGRLPKEVGGTLHYGKVWPNNTYKSKEYTFKDGTDITDYHVYALEWEPGKLSWFVDDECYYTMDKWFSQGKAGAAEYTSPAPFDVPFYLLLNLAVGGTFDAEADLDKAEFPASMEVDFVRVYEKEGGYIKLDNVTPVMTDSRDTVGFEANATGYEDGEFITDKEFATMNTEAITNTDTGIVPDKKDWQFAVGNFGGSATAGVEELAEGNFAKIDITSGGNQTYAVQLIQHLPLAEGYSYQVTFDAKATAPRTFVVSPSGDGDNGWSKYGSYEASVSEELSSHSFVFKMNNTTDPTARLEFNLGQATGSVWIGNVSVTVVDSEGGIDDDMLKPAIFGGNLIYNGTFDQGTERKSFWHIEGMDAYVPDYLINEDGTYDYSRGLEIDMVSANAKLYQTGLQLEAEKEYYLRLDMCSEQDTELKVVISGEDGTVYYEEVYSYKAAEGTTKAEFKFEMPANYAQEGATLTIIPAQQSRLRIDNVKLNKNLS